MHVTSGELSRYLLFGCSLKLLNVKKYLIIKLLTMLIPIASVFRVGVSTHKAHATY